MKESHPPQIGKPSLWIVTSDEKLQCVRPDVRLLPASRVRGAASPRGGSAPTGVLSGWPTIRSEEADLHLFGTARSRILPDTPAPGAAERKNFIQNREAPETVAIKYYQIPTIPEAS